MIRVIRSGYLGTQMPYMYENTPYTPAPEGYQPFFINHLGRHGARYLSSGKDLAYLMKEIEAAKAAHQLRLEGVCLQERLEKIAPEEESHIGLLTISGMQMEEGIARRMHRNFPEAFGRKITAVSTYVERTKQSMEAFLGALERWIPSSEVSASSDGRVDPILRFFDVNEAYLQYKKAKGWQKSVDEYAQREDVTSSILSQFFRREYIEQMNHPMDFVTSLYQVYMNQFDAKDNVGLGMYFTDKELAYLWENENLAQYYEKGPSYVGECLPTNIAFPLLMDFLTTSQKAIHTREQSAYLRFAHAETIIPFATLMRILGFFNQTNIPAHVAPIWKDYLIAPMAANMQWVFYEHPTEEIILLKILYNESEVRLPIRSVIGPYYNWLDVRSYYVALLKALDVDWNESLVEMVKKYDSSDCCCEE